MKVPVLLLAAATCAAFATVRLPTSSGPAAATQAGPVEDGIVRVKSRLGFADTIERLRADIEGKGIMFFQAIDQTRLAAGAGITLRPSTLLVFGNPGLGSHFITARPEAGLDWPVRLLVSQDDTGQVWASYTDFAWIAARHRITNRQAEFAMATNVIGSITASVAAP